MMMLMLCLSVLICGLMLMLLNIMVECSFRYLLYVWMFFLIWVVSLCVGVRISVCIVCFVLWCLV